MKTAFRRSVRNLVGTGVVLLAMGQAHATVLFNEDFADLAGWNLGIFGSTPWTTMLNDGDETVAIAGGSPINTYAMPSNNQVASAGITAPINAGVTLDVNLDVRVKSFAAGNEFLYTLFSENPQVPGDISTITLNVRHPSNAALGSSVKLLIRQATTIDPAGDITVYDSGYVATTITDDGDPFPINVSRNGAGLWTVTVDGAGVISGSESNLSTGLKIDYIRFQELTDSQGGAERRVFDNFTINHVPEPAALSLVSLGLSGLLIRRSYRRDR